MKDKGIIIKGNKDGVNILIDMDKYNSFDDMLIILIQKLSRSKTFYEESTIYITTRLSEFLKEDIERLRTVLFEDIKVKEIIFEDVDSNDEQEVSENTGFSGINEGRTKFIRKTIRGGQKIQYSGNLVIIGDINSGAEVYAGGNIIVLGNIKGNVFAGVENNREAIVAAFSLQPEILKIGDIITMSPDAEKPLYPEVAKVKDNVIIVEPYLNNKYI
ncbi:septum site-determining protein MinC [Clostridium sp. MSJ-8]|uniref:septum site-determining protein MinC n=1 Tax=Clostridium sp. MSJ-8 TaxID=2841510 RepID=UPI001C0F352A|nr:septum site-determining protein MinC [Clostridium sp. MSJ-8]MBU5488934.1 septum site-determining protein MinC [Clostridium sp. MSJ-8]